MWSVQVTHTRYILNLKDTRLPKTIGNKARRLRFLAEQGFKIPLTYVCTWDAYEEYLTHNLLILEAIKDEFLKVMDLNRSYAIRSSANIEDGSHYSFAGQFKSILNVREIDNILHAIETIWSSTGSEAVHTYLEMSGIDYSELKMAVIIQEMVVPSVSGVSFSRNPVTGMDEIIVEAVHGSGDVFLQNGTTPERWINKWGKWMLKPDNGTIALTIIEEVVAKTKEISHTYGSDIDLEWVYDGTAVHWVQLREITSLKNAGLYSNQFAREVFPGIIKPLIWSTNVPIVCGAWVKLFTELIGKNDIDPNSLAKSFYYRAYFNMGTIGKIFKALGLPRNTIELLLEVTYENAEKPSFKPTRRTLVLFPRIVRFILDKMVFERKLSSFFTTIKPFYQSFPLDQLGNLSPHVIINTIEQLYELNEKTAYHTIVTFLLMGLYNSILKSRLKKVGIDFDHLDVTRGMEELKRFDPNASLGSLHQKYGELDETTRETISTSSFTEFLSLKGIDEFQQKVIRFIQQFGHLSNSGNDFSSVPWRETPEVVLKMIANYTQPEDKATTKLSFEDLPLSPLHRFILGPLYRRARRFRLYREEISFLYTFGYGLFRVYFLALGDYLVSRGFVGNREDIFSLYFDEVKDIVSKNSFKDYKNLIDARKREIEDYQEITLPSTIYGDQPPPLRVTTGNTLQGIPTSKGYYQGRARVLKGIQDLSKVKEGDVLIIPYSDVGLTPLFGKAGAIIAESGGFLSHSSIIAREYGIPAIVSVPGACQLKDDTMVTVDGYHGEIIIHESSEK